MRKRKQSQENTNNRKKTQEIARKHKINHCYFLLFFAGTSAPGPCKAADNSVNPVDNY